MAAWLALFVAGLFEVGWAIGLKYTEGFSKLKPSILTVIAMTCSFVLLAYAVKTLPIGTAYAIWTGIGAAGTFVLAIILFQEPLTVMRVVCVAMIIAGIIGLKFFGSS